MLCPCLQWQPAPAFNIPLAPADQGHRHEACQGFSRLPQQRGERLLACRALQVDLVELLSNQRTLYRAEQHAGGREGWSVQEVNP